jgi:hypothetical protein
MGQPAGDLLERSNARLDEPVAGLLDERLNVVAGHLNVLHAELVDLAAVMLADPSAWRGPGVHTPELFLAWRTGLSPQRARQIVTIAERATELPECTAAFRRGELAVDQMAAIAKRAPWWIDREIVELGRMLTVTQLVRTLATYPFPDHPHPAVSGADEPERVAADVSRPDPSPDETVDDAPPDEAGRAGERPTEPSGGPHDSMWFGVGDDGRFRLHVETDAVTGMTLEAALREARDRLFREGGEVDWVDALRDVCERSLDAVTEPARRDRYRIHVHLRTDGECCDELGRRLPDAIRRQVTCDGLLTPTLVAGAVPVSVGRTSRTIPERTRRLVVLRDGGCAVPGCNRTHILEVHHIIHWEDLGPTETWNLIALCAHHHRMHHRGDLGIAGNADRAGGVTFTDRRDAPIRASGARPEPPGAPPPSPASRYEHPLGERLDLQSVHFREPRPAA